MVLNCQSECKDRVQNCNCSLCLNYENFFGTKVDTSTICEISSLNPYEVCKKCDCRKCYCANYEPCKGLVGCSFYVS